MSLLDDVSIVVTPNGVKAGTLYGAIPVPTEGSEEVTNGDFATDSDWDLGSSWDISGGKANYDAVSTGQELRQLMSSIDVGQLVNIVFEVSDIEGGKDAYFKLDCSGAPESVFTYTKFSAGTYTYAHAVTSGFSRLTFTALNSSTGGYFSIDNVSVKEYTTADMDVTRATDATRVNESGLIKNVLSNVPRIDYTGGGCPHILSEPQRINLMLYSEDYSSNWTTSNLSVVEHSTTSPSGGTNADKLKEDSSNSAHKIRYASPNTPVTNGAVYTMSFFAKKEERTSIRISNAAMSNTDGKFNLSNGQVISSGSSATNSMVDYGNGWYRCIMTFTSTTTIAQANIAILNANNDITYQGDGSSGLYMWGVQIEAGSYATSYIPNFGTSSGVTRAQDLFTRDGIGSLIGSEGVLFIEMAALSNDLTNRVISLNDGTSSNRLMLYFNSLSNTIAVVITSGGSTINYAVSDETSFNKMAVRYRDNDLTLWVDGQSRGTPITSATIPTFTALKFDSGIGASPFYGKVRQLQVYNTALGGSPYDATLSDARLAALTS